MLILLLITNLSLALAINITQAAFETVKWRLCASECSSERRYLQLVVLRAKIGAASMVPQKPQKDRGLQFGAMCTIT